MGTFSDMTVEVLRDNDIAYARTTVSTGNFSIPTDWLRMPATCHHNDERLFDLADKFVNGQPNGWDTPWLFYVWGHGYELDIFNTWDKFETMIKTIAEAAEADDSIVLVTNAEFYQLFKDEIPAWKE